MSEGIGSFIKRVFLAHDSRAQTGFVENRMRPPGAVDESRFMALCIRCNRCLEVCPYSSIKRAGLGATMGTPYVLAETKGCYLCMACCRLCPTAALDPHLRNPEKTRMGRAVIDSSICYSHLFLDHDVLPDRTGKKIGALCNTCYNVCPLSDTAIALEKNLFPKILDGCVGCGVCVERCPTRPRRAINVMPAGMGRIDEAGFYYQKAKRRFEEGSKPERKGPEKALKGEDLLREKSSIEGSVEKPTFQFPFEPPKSGEAWE